MTNFEQDLIAQLNIDYPDRATGNFRTSEIENAGSYLGISKGRINNYLKKQKRVRWGVYNLSAAVIPFTKEEEKPMTSVSSITNDEVFVPEKDPSFVAWGNFKDVEAIIRSGIFYPTYIMGLSGNGKTFMVEQACAKAGREYVRVQITPETDEDDLIGGFRLINGETVFSKGPVIKAMEKGAILLIDEIDRGSNKIMALQGVLEGKPVLIKKTGEIVKPAPGFNIISTANTKGKGSDDGRFIAATIIDEAFLERFTITIEQPYPTAATEKRIIVKHMEKFNCVDEDFADRLTLWSETIRKTYLDDGVDELISTRRLCHVVQTFAIFQDRKKAIELCVNRFDEDTKEAFVDLYSKVDAQSEEAPAAQQYLDDILKEAIDD